MLILLATLAGCPLNPDSNSNSNSNTNPPTSRGKRPSGTATLKRFGSADELLQYFKTQALESARFGGGMVFTNAAAGDSRGDAAPQSGGADSGGSMGEVMGQTPSPSGDGGSGASDDFTGTNVQTAGVDEADVIKTDGTYIYVARRGSLRVIKAAPRSELSETGQLALPGSEYIDSMYLFGTKVLLLSAAYDDRGGMPMRQFDAAWYPIWFAPQAVLYEIDVSNPAAPTTARRVELDGQIVNSRLVGERLIVVLRVTPDFPPNASARDIEASTLDDVLPQVRTGAGHARMVDWPQWYCPTIPEGYDMSAVVTLDANDVETVVDSVAVMANVGVLYASTQAVYLTDTTYDWWGYRENTTVHKLAYDENGAAQYVATGTFPGRPLNQFSLDEDGGYLRVATHVANGGFMVMQPGGPMVAVVDASGAAESGSGSTEPAGAGGGSASGNDGTTSSDDTATEPPPPTDLPYNAVFVLAEDAGKLNVVGEIRNIAPGERIYSARFLGPRGYLVTFRQIDPLFAIDFTTPTAPRLRGQLKVPGFSEYLHPLDTNHLIGVGRSTAPDGSAVPFGIQLSLFDVSDMDNPVVVEQSTIGGYGSYSEVSSDHKAFTYYESRGLLAIPAVLFGSGADKWDYRQTFNGIIVFSVAPATGFEELGRLESVALDVGGGYSYSAWTRSVFIGEDVYAVTPEGVRAATVPNFNETTVVTLHPLGNESPYGYGGGAGGATDGGMPSP